MYALQLILIIHNTLRALDKMPHLDLRSEISSRCCLQYYADSELL